MKALTIHNPYSHLLITPQDELPAGAIHKRCENRTWPAPFRGRFAIHAGVSMEWFANGDWPGTLETTETGAVLRCARNMVETSETRSPVVVFGRTNKETWNRERSRNR